MIDYENPNNRTTLKLAIIHTIAIKWKEKFSAVVSALDKLLVQLGIYATWSSSIAYLQKQLRIFISVLRHIFFCDYTFSYCMKPSGMTLFMCLHIYSLPSSAFLKIQLSGFY